MKRFLYTLFLSLFFINCGEENSTVSSIDPVHWEQRRAVLSEKDSLETGRTYLAIYSQIYSLSEHKTHNLTAMVSLRNMSVEDSIYITASHYYDTHGTLIRTYFDKPVYIAPLETLEIVIDEMDTSGGTGANFIFDWKIPSGVPEPLFEGVMSSTTSQQGLSFITEGKRIDK